MHLIMYIFICNIFDTSGFTDNNYYDSFTFSVSDIFSVILDHCKSSGTISKLYTKFYIHKNTFSIVCRNCLPSFYKLGDAMSVKTSCFG